MRWLTIFLFALIFLSCQKTKKEGEIGQGNDSVKVSNTEKLNIVIDTIKIKETDDKEKDFTFGGLYPKVRGLQNKEFENELNSIFIKNVDHAKSDGDGLELGIGFEVFTLNDTLVSIVQPVWGRFSGTGTSCGMLGHTYSVNADLKNEKILTNTDLKIEDFPVSEYNKVLEYYFKYISIYPIESLDYVNGFGDDQLGIFDFIPKIKNVGQYKEISFAVRNDSLIVVEYAMPTACVSKGIYHIPVKSVYSNTINLPDVKVLYSKMASEIVRSWIEALGRRDFQTAHGLMSTYMTYDLFSSPKRYGGITKTLVHSIETTSSTGCNFDVIAIYDSYDPSNRDGKYTEKFSVSNCYGLWTIKGVKNISIEYYR
jgi:hypothetical protein